MSSWEVRNSKTGRFDIKCMCGRYKSEHPGYPACSNFTKSIHLNRPELAKIGAQIANQS